jgi:hypothetical protein
LGGEWKWREDNTWLSSGRLTRTKEEISQSIGFDSYLEAVSENSESGPGC